MTGRWYRGRVVDVPDGDDLLVDHTPGFGWTDLVGLRFPRKDNMLVRLAGVDAPELSHKGRPAQAHAAESLEWLRNRAFGKVIYFKILKVDQYNRVVALVHNFPFLLPGRFFTGENINECMLREGIAAIYEQSGGVFGEPGGKQKYLALQKKAQDEKLGMWSDGIDIETPAQYKRYYAGVLPKRTDFKEIAQDESLGTSSSEDKTI